MKNSELIKKMTLEEKASLTSGKDFWQTQEIDRLGVKSIFLSDGPHGLRRQAEEADHLGLNPSIPATCFPTAATMANSWDVELGKELGVALGQEGVAQHVNVILGPGLCIKRNPKCGRNFEYFSEDPYLAGKMAASYVQGIQSNGIASCVKHFACNNQEYKRMTIDSVLDERTLREIYLTNFEIAVKEGGAKVIMSSYNSVNGAFANENKHLLVDILRNEWGFEGMVVTDWGGNNDRVEGLKCFDSLEMPTTAGETNKDIIRAIKDGVIEEKLLDQNIDYLLTLNLETNKVFEKKVEPFDVKAHHEIALKCAENSAVLLKNNDHVLPLKKDSKVCVIGDFATNPRYQGAGSSIVNCTKLDEPLKYIVSSKLLNYIGYEKGFDRYGKKKKGLIKKACKLANEADFVLLYLGLDEVVEAEGLDRSNIKLAQNQIDLIKALREQTKAKIIVILSCGSSIEMDFEPYCDAIVHMYLAGQAGARAALHIIDGRVNPSGKLNETIAYKYEDYPSSPYFPGKGKTIEYREGIFVGYRYFDTANLKPRYPFGFGLSFTEFEYSDLKVDQKGVTFTIKNVGEYDGKEIAQLYIGKEDSKIFRPKKELKGFSKVFIKKGSSVKVTIPFDDKSFRYFNVKTNKWEVEDGNYEIYIGASVEDIRLKGSIKQKGTTKDLPYDETLLADYYSANIKNVNDNEFKELIGREIPKSTLNFYKKNRIVIDYNTTVEELRYSRGWTGRFFSWVIRFIIKMSKAFGNVGLANTLIMGVVNQPMRGLSRMTNGAISWLQLNGLIFMFNGHFHRGLHRYFKAGRAKKRERKAEAKAKKAEAKKA